MMNTLESLAILAFYEGMLTTREVIDESTTCMLFFANAIEKYAWSVVIAAVDKEMPWKRVMMTERFGKN